MTVDEQDALRRMLSFVCQDPDTILLRLAPDVSPDAVARSFWSRIELHFDIEIGSESSERVCE